MSKRLFVGNLNEKTTESDLLQLFEGIGAVKSVQIVMDSTSGASGGFGFVKTSASAHNAIEQLNEMTLHGNRIKVGVVNEPQLPQGRIPEPPKKTTRKTTSKTTTKTTRARSS
jgi:RNA recognition motif-containing protein